MPGRVWCVLSEGLVVPPVFVAVLVRCAEVRVSVAVAHLIATEVLDMRWLMMRVEMLAARWIFAVPPIMVIEVVVDVAQK
jgi:hypothetical protein